MDAVSLPFTITQTPLLPSHNYLTAPRHLSQGESVLVFLDVSSVMSVLSSENSSSHCLLISALLPACSHPDTRRQAIPIRRTGTPLLQGLPFRDLGSIVYFQRAHPVPFCKNDQYPLPLLPSERPLFLKVVERCGAQWLTQTSPHPTQGHLFVCLSALYLWPHL